MMQAMAMMHELDALQVAAQYAAGELSPVDVARAWGPGAEGSDWFVDAGLGLRVSLPQWSLGQVLRFDVAWPLYPRRDGQRRPVLSFGSNQAF